MKHFSPGVSTLIFGLLLSACGGGGSGSGSMGNIGEDLPVARLEGILERTDTVRISTIHAQYSNSRWLAVDVSCDGTRCVLNEGGGISTVIDLSEDLIDPVTIEEVHLESHGEFATITVKSGVDLWPVVLHATSDNIYTYGFWGEHGFAGVLHADRPISGESKAFPTTATSDWGRPMSSAMSPVRTPPVSGARRGAGLSRQSRK